MIAVVMGGMTTPSVSFTAPATDAFLVLVIDAQLTLEAVVGIPETNTKEHRVEHHLESAQRYLLHTKRRLPAMGAVLANPSSMSLA
jgi:hypothetical protein